MTLGTKIGIGASHPYSWRNICNHHLSGTLAISPARENVPDVPRKLLSSKEPYP